MKLGSNSHKKGATLVEVMVALGVLAMATIFMTQAMLVLNRSASMSRVRNLAKAAVLGRIQEVGVLPYDPAESPPKVPAPLALGTSTETVNLGAANTGIGQVPATLRWTVTNVGSTTIRSVRCRVEYTFLGRAQNYEVLTFRSPD